MPKVGNETYLFCQLVQNQAKQRQLDIEREVVNNNLKPEFASGRVAGIEDVLGIMLILRVDMERR